MKARDLVIVGTVLLVGGFAAADALRGDGDSAAPATTATTRPERAETQREPEEEQATVETVAGPETRPLAGSLVYTDRACALRRLDLRSGRNSGPRALRTNCEIAAAYEGARVAVGFPSRFRGVAPYRVIDLEAPDPPLATFRARIRSIVWSLDGERVAWCDPSGRGFELELGSDPRGLPGCPAAYTRRKEPVFVEGRKIFVGEREILSAPEDIRAVSYDLDGTAAVATRSRLILYANAETWSPVVLRERILPIELRGLDVRFSPSLCHAALLSSVFPPTPTVFVLDVRRCPGSRAPLSLAGRAAAWSPGGGRLAVAERQRVVIHPVFGDEQAVSLEIGASGLAWKN